MWGVCNELGVSSIVVENGKECNGVSEHVWEIGNWAMYLIGGGIRKSGRWDNQESGGGGGEK